MIGEGHDGMTGWGRRGERWGEGVGGGGVTRTS